MRKIFNKIDKAVVATYPLVNYEGRIFTVITPEEAERACKYLSQFTLLGIDTETRPTFQRGGMHQVALLQVATEDSCFLFRLNRIGLLPCMIRILENPAITKVGLSLKDDWSQLSRRKHFTPSNVVEIQQLVKEIGIEDMSLQKIYANLFQQRISKSQQLSNWEADALSSAQQKYAALDAYACIKIYKEISDLMAGKKYRLVHAPQPQSLTPNP